MGNSKAKEKTWRWILRMAAGTLVLAVIFGLITELLLERIQFFSLSLIILLIVVFIGVIFDTIGTSAAAAKLSPLNAKAARKVPGARKGVELVKNADRVANFCNDVIGDITGIISGGLAAVIVFNLANYTNEFELYLRIIMTAIVAALTVGGKAWGKYAALRWSTEIMIKVGLLLTRMENIWPVRKKKQVRKS